ncbi:MAG: GyrI-like domain-containing protein, partial [Planctomycetota bacterium]|nr:GyrI-like domain-containing protein [Planctomycetota bacterium]
MLTPRIETKEPIHLIGLHARFIGGTSPDSNAGEVVGPLWGQFSARLQEIQRTDESVCYGYSCWGDPAERSRPDEVEYLAGAPAAADAPVPEGMVAVETAGGLYAVFEHHGPITTFHETLQAIYGEWLPSSEYEGSGLGDVEVYDERWKDGGE